MKKELQHRLFALMRLSFPRLREHVIRYAIEDAISELEEKLFRESITLSPQDYYNRCYQSVWWKLLDHTKTAHRYVPIEDAEAVADEFSIEDLIESEETMNEALTVLTDKERSLVMMQIWGRFPIQRIAAICRVKIGAVNAVLANAKKKMRMTVNTPLQ